MTTTLETCHTNSRELADRVLPFLRRHDGAYRMSALIDRFAVSKTKMWAAVGMLLSANQVQCQQIDGVKCYSSKAEGDPVPPPAAPNMTSVYKLPQELVMLGKRADEARLIKSIG